MFTTLQKFIYIAYEKVFIFTTQHYLFKTRAIILLAYGLLHLFARGKVLATIANTRDGFEGGVDVPDKT